MHGLMQNWPLTVDKILDHAALRHGQREIVSRSVEGPIVRTTYAQMRARAKQVSYALLEMGVKPGDRVATLAWNTARHMEIWYGIMGIGAVCHTLNPRLHPDQICWIAHHAGDKVIFTDLTFAPMLLANTDKLEQVERIVVMSDEAHRPAGAGSRVLMYEDWLAGRPTDDAPWGQFDEQTACGLCYTSGTTGDPKGVLYSHRSNFIHTFITLQADVMGMGAADVVLPVVPMFHANAWGIAFSAPGRGGQAGHAGRQDGRGLDPRADRNRRA